LSLLNVIFLKRHITGTDYDVSKAQVIQLGLKIPEGGADM